MPLSIYCAFLSPGSRKKIIMGILGNISVDFWSPDIWLPENATWENIAPTPENKFANYRHLIYPLPMALGLLVLRYALERYVRNVFNFFLFLFSTFFRRFIRRLSLGFTSGCQRGYVCLTSLIIGIRRFSDK